MSSAAVNKAANQIIDKLNAKYDQLGEDFLADVRGAIVDTFKPLMKKNGKEKKPRGVTAFNLYVRQFNGEHKDDAPVMDKDGKVKSLFARAGEEWSAAAASVKEEYAVKAKELNTKNGIVPDGPKAKKPVNGYNVFVKEYKVKNSATLKGGSELFKQASALWKSMTEAQQTEYKTQAVAQNTANGLGKVQAPAMEVSAAS